MREAAGCFLCLAADDREQETHRGVGGFPALLLGMVGIQIKENGLGGPARIASGRYEYEKALQFQVLT